MEQDQKQINTDLELVEKVKTGDRKAFSELVRRHQRSLLRISLRFVKDINSAEDIVQEAFIKAFEKIHSFEGRASFKSWLFQIAVNSAKNKLRGYRYNMVTIDNVHLAVAAQAETTLVHTAVADLIQNELDKLPQRQRMALVLRVYEDLSFQEIAEIMECPYDTAKANYRHAIMKLKVIFTDNSDLKDWTSDIGGFFMEMNHQLMEAEG